MLNIINALSKELDVNSQQIKASIALFDEGATVPFVARYRKEATGGLDDSQLRQLEQRLSYLRELEERKTSILNSIKEQGKLTTELAKKIDAVDNKAKLEDLYLPYKPKKHSKAQIAREAGLEPLAIALYENPNQNPDELAAQYINAEKNITDATSALDGAFQILMEKFSEDAELIEQLRDYMWKHGIIESYCIEGKENEGQKFSDYFSYSEAIKSIPSHRALALFRGRREKFLRLSLILNTADEQNPCEEMLNHYFQLQDQSRAADAWLQKVIRFTWRVKLFPKIELELMAQLREQAETAAIKVFADNMVDLLMAAPAGEHVTMGLDPGYRTGVKVAIVDVTGKLLEHSAIFPHAPQKRWDESIEQLTKLCQRHKVSLISIGNGTASRETEKLVAELIKKHSELHLTKIVTSEAGASVYSASELAANEFPDLDVTIRGAVSIARRLQDPLAELVKIDPKAIGVGQYQHDVNQVKLAKALDDVIEDCVNQVGVDINTASGALLARVAGLSKSLAQNIVEHRDKNGVFTNRSQLQSIPRMGEKTFQQAAGFLRVNNSDNPLDASAVHPESYVIVEKICNSLHQPIATIIANQKLLKSLRPNDYTDDTFGLPTIIDIIAELEKPGRDPRPSFTTAKFRDDIEKISDLKTDMVLEGVVTNVTNFGAFVDIGVHQDGLVHCSMLANRYVSDPRDVVKIGMVVKVKVLEVDTKRNRISLSMKHCQN